MNIQENPWLVRSIDEFLYYCCPECDTKDQSKDLFIKHALDKHSNSTEYIVHLAIKKEQSDGDFEDLDTSFDETEFVEPKTELT